MVAEHLRPIFKWQVGRHDDTVSFISRCDHAEQQLGASFAVRKWLRKPDSLQNRSPEESTADAQRLTKERVGRVIALIGQEADIVVQDRDDEQRKRLKYASAHDVRRGCAQRLINQGVSAESLKLILRHADFATTEKFYGAVKSAQSASSEIRSLASSAMKEETADLSAAELLKLRKLLSQI